MAIVTIAGSPTSNSRSTRLLDLAAQRLRSEGLRTESITVRDLPATELLAANTQDDAIAAAVRAIEQAHVVIIATPVYKASYSGLLKSFLDLLPQYALRNKAILPIATGGSPAHLLALDYALRPVLSAMGASIVVESLFAADSQVVLGSDGSLSLDPAIQTRFDAALLALQKAYGWLSSDSNDASLPSGIPHFPLFAV